MKWGEQVLKEDAIDDGQEAEVDVVFSRGEIMNWPAHWAQSHYYQ